MDTYDYVAEAVRNFWKKTHPQTVIVFFDQKYEYESDDEWEHCQEMVDCYSDIDCEHVEFQIDFCEGQTCIRNIKVVPLDIIVNFYEKNATNYVESQWICNSITNIATCGLCLGEVDRDKLTEFCPYCGTRMFGW